ncbi:plasma membrane phosphate transporter Pho87 [Pelomyxa schiedti]|nr:plasma membrane phosphate transporter Pho87 [Pelomyxa schiedti]
MKFGKQLKFLAKEQWKQYYIDFSALKQILKDLKKTAEKENRCTTVVKEKVVEGSEEGPKSVEEVKANITPQEEEHFLNNFVEQIQNIESFFRQKFDTIVEMFKQIEGDGQGVPGNLALFKKRVHDMLILVEDLIDFCHLNSVGCTKILKKFTRHTTFSQRDSYDDLVKSQTFVANIAVLEKVRTSAKRIYVTAIHKATQESNEKILQELEQSVQAAHSWKLNTILFQFDEHVNKAQLVYKVYNIKPLPIAVALIIGLILYFIPIFAADKQPEQRCFALLVVSIILWVSECWPLFLTAIFIPFLVTISYCVYNDNKTVMNPTQAAGFALNAMWSSIIFLMLGGFSIAGGLKKYGIDQRIAFYVLKQRLFATPMRFVFGLEVLALFLSMWISNVAGPVICMTVSLPVIRDLPSNSRFIKLILLCIAAAGNAGGMTTPISSPQNAVAIQTVNGLNPPQDINFALFFIISLPTAVIMTICGHFLIMFMYKPDIKELPQIHTDVSEPIPIKGYLVLLAGITSIILWFCSQWLNPYVGNIGILSIIPILLFFGTGLLGKEEFDNLPWNLMILLAGGSVLGKAVQKSALLTLISDWLLDKIDTNNVYVMLVIFNIIMMIVGGFVSHTVSALILLPLFAQVGDTFGHAKALVMCGVCICCGSMPLPISSFPNLNSISLQDEHGDPYLTTLDFIKVGVPLTLVAFVCSISINYGLCLAFNY